MPVILIGLLIAAAAYLKFGTKEPPESETNSENGAPGEPGSVQVSSPSQKASGNVKKITVGKPGDDSYAEVIVDDSGNENSADADFTSLTDSAFRSLPRFTDSDLKNLSQDQVHETPQVLLEHMKPFIKVTEAERKNPKLAEDALAFYKKCASDGAVVDVARARCLHHAQETGRKVGKPVSLSDYPEEIQTLADFLPF